MFADYTNHPASAWRGPALLMKKSTIKRTLTTLGLIGLTTLLAGKAQATPLVNEAFDEYANGTTLDSTGNWYNINGTTLPLTVNSGTVNVVNLASGTSGEDDGIKFASTPMTGMLYYSALITVPTGTTAAAAGDYFFSGYGSGGYLGRVSLDQGATAGTLVFGLSNNLAGTANIALGTNVITPGSEYRLVLQINPSTGTSSFNYQLATATPFADTSTFIAGGGAAGFLTGLDTVALRQGSATGDAYTNTIDGIKVGTTLADVSGITTGASPFFNVVPEPSTYAALGLGVLALLGVQRMRRRTA